MHDLLQPHGPATPPHPTPPHPTPLQFVCNPKVASPRTARSAISALLQLKSTLRALPELGALLGAPHDNLLRAIVRNVTAPDLEAIASIVDGVLTEDTTWSRSPAAMRTAECFAVRPNIDGNLDAVRAVSVERSGAAQGVTGGAAGRADD